MGDYTVHSRCRRALIFMLPALAARLSAQTSNAQPPVAPDSPEPVRLPNGKLQSDEIARVTYEQNLKDAGELTNLARSFEEDLEKDDRFVLSLSSLKKLDDIEKLTRRIRGRLKHY